MTNKLKWFKIIDNENSLVYVISATNHSRAKLFLHKILGELDSDFDALSFYNAKVIKEKLSREPVEEGENFERDLNNEDWKELLEKGIYYYVEEKCPHCGENGRVYFENRFYCEKCEKVAKRTIFEWAKSKGLYVKSPDGFDRTNPNLNNELFTEKEFNEGLGLSTIISYKEYAENTFVDVYNIYFNETKNWLILSPSQYNELDGDKDKISERYIGIFEDDDSEKLTIKEIVKNKMTLLDFENIGEFEPF